MAAEQRQHTVEFSALVRRAAEDSYLSLKDLVEKSNSSEERSDSEKKVNLLKFIFNTRQRMLRLHVLAKWCHQVPLFHYCHQLAAILSSHDACFTHTAYSLFYMRGELQKAPAPLFDVQAAIEILRTGGYQQLPKCIEDLAFPATLAKDQQKPAFKKLNTLLRSKLLETSLPKEISEVKVSDGTAVLHVHGEFKAFLTLGYQRHLSMWRILHLELLLGEKNGIVKLEKTRRGALGDDLERRMSASKNPLMILYKVLHLLCASLVVDTVLRQVQVLRQNRWKDAVHFEFISSGAAGQDGNASGLQWDNDGELGSAGKKIRGLKIIYWLDVDKIARKSNPGSSLFLKVDLGQDLQLKCLHSSFILDPVTDKEAVLSLDQSCIDAEELLLRAIVCNRHTRLLEIKRELIENVQIYQVSGDVILKHTGDGAEANLRKKDSKVSFAGYCGDEVLQVRSYGESYITLGINIRSGRFHLQSSRNIPAQSALVECEEALNLGSMNATEVFLSLRRKSILHLFASTGRLLGLKVFEKCATALKIPKPILHGSDLLLMGFPPCGNSNYLFMQLDNDFKPIVYLLEAQSDPGGKSYSINDVDHVIRFNKIDIDQIQVVEDELNISLLDWEKLHSLPNVGTCNKISEHKFLPELELKPPLQLPGCSQSSFSSIVDEMFELEKISSGPSFPVEDHSSSKMSPFSQLSSSPINHQRKNAGVTSPQWVGGLQHSQITNIATVSNSSLSLSDSVRVLLRNGAANSLSSSSLLTNSSSREQSTSNPVQNFSIQYPHLGEFGQYSSTDKNLARLVKESPEYVGNMISGSRPVTSLRSIRSNSWNVAPTCQTSVKRSFSDILMLIPSFQGLKTNSGPRKRRRISKSGHCHPTASQIPSSVLSCKTGGYTYGSLLAEVNHGLAPSKICLSVLTHVIKHCSLYKACST